jgi:periplasmic protein TonB
MSVLEKSAVHLEDELTPDPVMAPAAGSLILHAGLAAAVVLWGVVGGFFHHSLWGSAGAGGAIQVNLVSSALPLPTNQPVNQNVLSTEKPSEAPAPPAPKEIKSEDLTAIPIQGKPIKPEQKPVQRTPPQKQPPPSNTRAAYGEQSGSSIPRDAQPSLSSGPTTVSSGDFGSLYAYYVRGISTKMAQNWYKTLVDPSTPRGARAYIDFQISRDGTVGNPKLDRSSGSSTLDRSCLDAARRVDTFGPLPSGYNQSTLLVSYYCEY